MEKNEATGVKYTYKQYAEKITNDEVKFNIKAAAVAGGAMLLEGVSILAISIATANPYLLFAGASITALTGKKFYDWVSYSDYKKEVEQGSNGK